MDKLIIGLRCVSATLTSAAYGALAVGSYQKAKEAETAEDKRGYVIGCAVNAGISAVGAVFAAANAVQFIYDRD